ncbi:hypothetical protein PUMCH_003100 [Australozyma saopauloensis]|uniref:U3 small nucleolar RNA-associated protein 4 n=1 Tax=Australozyma saopauloensis TaxID=291208 RepID=A0AAX4HBM1_9ASCO|nr:hypothetical protein PUMCH_003100 [[Candida] saopauloensis]
MDIHRCRFVDYTPHIITALAFSHTSDSTKNAPAGLRLAVGRSNGDIEIWNPRFNWTHELTLPGARGRAVEGLVWSHTDGENPRLFSIGGSTYITEWDLKTGRPKANLNCNAGVIWCIDGNSSGSRLAVGCDDGSIVIINLAGGPGVMEFEFICQKQDLRVLGVRWYDDKTIIGGCADGKVRCWSLEEENRGRITGSMKVDRLKTESTLVWSIVCLPSKNQFVTGDSTGAVKFWDAKTHTLVQSFTTHEADVLCLSKDSTGNKIFSAGIDRRIHNYSYLESKNKKGSRWIHNDSRLLHLNDVRALEIFECKAYNFLVSGGVERSLIVQSVDKFQHGPYKKILMDQQISNIATCPDSELVALFQDQTVKVWRIGDEKHKLVAKITLSEDDNVTSISIAEYSEDVTVLVVSTINTVKTFSLTRTENKLQVRKYRDESFDSVVSGAKKVHIFDDCKLLIQTPEDELFIFQIGDTSIELIDEIETLDSEGSELKGGFDHFNAIRTFAFTNDCSRVAIARFNNTVELLSTNGSEEPRKLTTLSNLVHLMQFTDTESLVILSDDNKILELNTSLKQKTNLLTQWSQNNSEYLPNAFLKMDQKAQGMFVQGKKVWIYGSQWLSFFDLSLNLQVSKQKSKKRARDGLSIKENDVENLEEAYFEKDLATALIRREDVEYPGKGEMAFWMTQKYRPILKVDPWGEQGIVVIEREVFALPATAAFELPLMKI